MTSYGARISPHILSQGMLELRSHGHLYSGGLWWFHRFDAVGDAVPYFFRYTEN